MEVSSLRATRIRRLMTQADLAEAAGMTKATISRLETGATKARISTIRRLAAALGVDPTELIYPWDDDHQVEGDRRTQ